LIRLEGYYIVGLKELNLYVVVLKQLVLFFGEKVGNSLVIKKEVGDDHL